MRLLHVLPSLREAYGGPLRLVVDLSARSQAHGVESIIVGVNGLDLQDSPIPLSHFRCFSGGNEMGYAYSSELRQWLQSNVQSFDAVAIHGAWHYPGWAAHVSCLSRKVPYVYIPHGMLEQWAVKRQGLAKHIKKRLYWQLCEKTLVNKAARVWFTTRREEERTRCIFDIVVPSNIVSVYGIEAVEHGDIDNSYDNRKIPDKRIALFLGRLHPKKNVPFLLRCWREAKVSSEWVLVVAGSGDPVYEAQVRNQVRALGLSSQVYFAGFVSGREKTRLLQRAEWFLLPSSQENFGVAVLEAVAHGCAVAIADQVYLSESFRPGSVVLPLEFEAWTEFLRGPLQDLKFARMTAEADKAYLLKSFAMELVVSRWVAAFRQLCES